jgi:hypothetical protein
MMPDSLQAAHVSLCDFYPRPQGLSSPDLTNLAGECECMAIGNSDTSCTSEIVDKLALNCALDIIAATVNPLRETKRIDERERRIRAFSPSSRTKQRIFLAANWKWLCLILRQSLSQGLSM